MSETFLDRWARRKRDVAQQEAKEQTPKVVEDLDRELSARAPAESESPAAHEADQPGFDLSQLPSLESITAQTDIRAFLAPGVPASLRHAALRRAWSADPTIRDFIGLSENAWDFTAPDGVPGFGPIGSPEEVRQLLAQFMGEPTDAGQKSASEAGEDIPQVSAAVEESDLPVTGPSGQVSEALQPAPQEKTDPDKRSERQNTEMLQHNKEHAALQQDGANTEYAPTSGRRPHGRALPQ